MTFAVVTDSAACLPAPVAAGHGIRVVDLHALPGPDGQPATTARPSVQELAEAYRDALRGVDEVLALHVTAALSGTIDNARLAAEAVAGEGRVEVVDLGVSGGALGLSVLAAAEADDMRRGAARARESASRSHLFFLVEDLSYLRRGGRIDRRSAALGVLALTAMIVVRVVAGMVQGWQASVNSVPWPDSGWLSHAGLLAMAALLLGYAGMYAWLLRRRVRHHQRYRQFDRSPR